MKIVHEFGAEEVLQNSTQLISSKTFKVLKGLKYMKMIEKVVNSHSNIFIKPIY
jgi:hypothetical protein